MAVITSALETRTEVHDPSYMGKIAAASTPGVADPRLIENGIIIPTESYCEQIYVVHTADGGWLCVANTGKGKEGEPGQHVVVRKSMDRGHTWSAPIDVESADAPESGCGVLYVDPFSGRVYCFYCQNVDNLRRVRADNPPYPDGYCNKVDNVGYFVMRFSDNHGVTWSRDRYIIPVRCFKIDQENPYGGKVRFAFNVGKPVQQGGNFYITLHKIGRFGYGLFARSEGVLLHCPNFYSESNPAKFIWNTLPDGDIGLRAPAGGGEVAEEHCLVRLSDNTFYSIYRTIDGWPAFSLSRDLGHHWTDPQYLRYADGRLIKNPRAANFLWKCANGMYLYWFHNNGGIQMARREFTFHYKNRNPAWLCAAMEIDGKNGKELVFSQPEIVLYDDDPMIRMSYPDYLEEEGIHYLVEAQKHVARIHVIDPDLLRCLFGQFTACEVSRDSLVAELGFSAPLPGPEISMPPLPLFCARNYASAERNRQDLRQGFSLEVLLALPQPGLPKTLLNALAPDGSGIRLSLQEDNSISIYMNDGQTASVWSSTPPASTGSSKLHVMVIVDGGPKIISFVLDGRLDDGGDIRQFGWGRFSPMLENVNGRNIARLDPSVLGIRIYQRALRVSEAIGNYRACLPKKPGEMS